MNASADIDFSRPAGNGVYVVGDDDLQALAMQAARDELQVRRIALDGCRDKTELLRRIAQALPLPASFGGNWDALADCLHDPRWAPGWGHALLFDHADELRRADERDFDILLGILDDAATFASELDRPFFALLSLPEQASRRQRAELA
jgi:RNAse (barnase) inhibitor barstar